MLRFTNQLFRHPSADLARIIYVETINTNLNFKEIDARIMQDTNWSDTYPAKATFNVPHHCDEEIILKLKAHQEITAVNGKQTARGIAVHKELRKKFEKAKMVGNSSSADKSEFAPEPKGPKM